VKQGLELILFRSLTYAYKLKIKFQLEQCFLTWGKFHLPRGKFTEP